jgi:hypothetical protein
MEKVKNYKLPLVIFKKSKTLSILYIKRSTSVIVSDRADEDAFIDVLHERRAARNPDFFLFTVCSVWKNKS